MALSPGAAATLPCWAIISMVSSTRSGCWWLRWWQWPTARCIGCIRWSVVPILLSIGYQMASLASPAPATAAAEQAAPHPGRLPDGDDCSGAVAALPGGGHGSRQYCLHGADAGRLCGGLAGGQRTAGPCPPPCVRNVRAPACPEPAIAATNAAGSHNGAVATRWLAQRIQPRGHHGLDLPDGSRGSHGADCAGPRHPHRRTRAGHAVGLADAADIARVPRLRADLLRHPDSAFGRWSLQPVAMGRCVGGTPGWCRMNRYRMVISGLWFVALALVGWTLVQMPLGAIMDTVASLTVLQWLLFAALNTTVVLALTQRWRGLINTQRQQVSLAEIFLIRQAGQCISFITPGPQFGGEPFQLYWIWKRCSVPLHHGGIALALDRFMELWINFAVLLMAACYLFLHTTDVVATVPWLSVGLVIVLPLAGLSVLLWLIVQRPEKLTSALRRIAARWAQSPRLTRLGIRGTGQWQALQ